MHVIPAPAGTRAVFRVGGEHPQMRSVPIVGFWIDPVSGEGEALLLHENGTTVPISRYPAGPDARLERIDPAP
jgi:hypothetical protein